MAGQITYQGRVLSQKGGKTDGFAASSWKAYIRHSKSPHKQTRTSARIRISKTACTNGQTKPVPKGMPSNARKQCSDSDTHHSARPCCLRFVFFRLSLVCSLLSCFPTATLGNHHAAIPGNARRLGTDTSRLHIRGLKWRYHEEGSATGQMLGLNCT